MSTSPLGQRARLKGPQVHKRVMMKPQSSSYLVQVKLPSTLQRALRTRTIAAETVSTPAGSGLAAAAASRNHRPIAEEPISTVSVRLPQFSEEEVGSGEFLSAYRGVVTVTVPSAASCCEVIDDILTATGCRERPPSNYQLIQCFADFSPDHTRRRLTGDSKSAPIKAVMQFPFHLALILSPFVVLREELSGELEPRGRAAIVESYRHLFMSFIANYQVLLCRMIEQYQFLEGREAEGRRGKKYEERQQFFELVRFRTLTDEKRQRRDLELRREAIHRAQILCEFLAVKEKIEQLCCRRCTSTRASPVDGGDGTQPSRTSCCWMHEHALFLQRMEYQLNDLFFQHMLLSQLRVRYDALSAFREALMKRFSSDKEHLYTVSRISKNVVDAVATTATTEVVEAARTRESWRSMPDHYDSPMVANPKALCGDVFLSSRSFL